MGVKYRENSSEQWREIAALKGDKGDAGASGVHIGTDTPPDNANVWVDTSGEPSSTETWTFTLEDGTTVSKTVVVVN